jgi:hypothetical protein
LNAPLSSRTKSKTMGTANAIHKCFTRMETQNTRHLQSWTRTPASSSTIANS